MSSTDTPARQGRVVVLAGGLSHERDVSLRSGRRVAEALRGTGVEVEERDVDAGLLPALTADPPACVVPMLHGETGEDGAIREVLELLGLAYVGTGPRQSRSAWSKPVAKSTVLGAGITTPERIREGVRRLAGVLEAEMELRATFGASGPSHELPRSGYDAPSSDLS